MSVFGRKFCNKKSRKFAMDALSKHPAIKQLVKISSMFSQVLSGLEPPLDLSTTIFGHKVVLKINFSNLNKIGFNFLPFSDMKVSLPFFACPTAGNRMFHTEGELATAKVKILTPLKAQIDRF